MARPGALTTRLLAAQIAVAVAATLTMVTVAVLTGPALFEAHMRQAGHTDPVTLAHSHEAFQVAGLLALGMGAVITVAGAVLVSLFLNRRLRRDLAGLDGAARRIAAGDYASRLGEPPARELATLTDSFDAMAGTLASVESARRRLLTDLAHEIRTPLATLDVCLESLEDEALAPGQPVWDVMRTQVQRISRLSDDLRDVSAAEEGRLGLRLQPLEPATLMQSVVEGLREGFARADVRLSVDSDPGAAMIAGDPDRLGQVLTNLLTNALRHTPPGGVVRVLLTAEDGRVRLGVLDSGDGIAAADLPHVFERFYRVDTARDRAHGGTGVGLTISRAIARAHGGELTVDSAGVGRGAQFWLTLPVGGA